MEYLNREGLRKEINRLSTIGIPFLFLINFKGERGMVVELSKLIEKNIYCSINGVEIGKNTEASTKSIAIEKDALPFALYKERFDKVIERIKHGDTYLLNLTFPTQLHGEIDLKTIYTQAKARYKFLLEEQFLFYSPEPFIRIDKGRIYSFPMKGTISAKEENAAEKLLASTKELREHNTIVDLIRNDLSIVATDVQVDDFRYIEAIRTPHGKILQTSTQISGNLSNDWGYRLGDILMALLPAGSISGAPKERTIEIIEEVEIDERGFYTGIMGICGEGKVDSCVNIRFLEHATNGRYYYRSGGGITALSLVEEEYQELLTKIYVPIV